MGGAVIPNSGGTTAPTSGGNSFTNGPYIPTGDWRRMTEYPYNLGIAQAQLLSRQWPHGYYVQYRDTKTGVLYAPTTGGEFAEAMDLMGKNIGTQVQKNLESYTNKPPTSSKSSSWATATVRALDGESSFTSVPVGDWYVATPTKKAKGSTKSVDQMTQKELTQWTTNRDAAAQTNAATIYAQGNVKAAQINAAGNARAAQIGAQGQIEAGVAGAAATSRASIQDEVMNTLDSWGMASKQMQNEVKFLVQNDNLVNQAAVLDVIRASAAYKSAFFGLEERNSKLGPGGEHMTESQYQQYVSQVQNMLGTYGIPANMVTKRQIGEMIANNVSTTEFEARITKGYLAYKNADAGTKAILQKEYGIGPNLGAAYFLNPGLAEAQMEKAVASATIQNYAVNVGLKDFGQQDAEQLFAKMRLSGVTNSQGALANPYSQYTMTQAQQDLLSAAKDEPLTGSLPGAGQPTVDTKTLLGANIAGFGGTNQRAAQIQVARAEQAKVAPFEKGGGYEETDRGVTGIGAART